MVKEDDEPSQAEIIEQIIEQRERYIKDQPELFRTMLTTIEADIERTSDEKLKAQLRRQLVAFHKQKARFEKNLPKFMADTEAMKKVINSLK